MLYDDVFTVNISNIATKPSSHNDGWVDRLSMLTNVPDKSDLAVAIYGTIVCYRIRFQKSQYIA